MSNISVVILAAVLVVLCNGSSLDNDIVCKAKWTDGGVLDEEAHWEEINKKCLETNMFDDRAMAEKLNSTLEEFLQVDDNCFVHCTYKLEEMLNKDETINRNETMRIFKGNLTSEVMNKAMSIWTDCITESESIARKNGANRCRMLMVHDFCFSTRALEANLFQMECHEQKPTS